MIYYDRPNSCLLSEYMIFLYPVFITHCLFLSHNSGIHVTRLGFWRIIFAYRKLLQLEHVGLIIVSIGNWSYFYLDQKNSDIPHYMTNINEDFWFAQYHHLRHHSLLLSLSGSGTWILTLMQHGFPPKTTSYFEIYEVPPHHFNPFFRKSTSPFTCTNHTSFWGYSNLLIAWLYQFSCRFLILSCIGAILDITLSFHF